LTSNRPCVQFNMSRMPSVTQAAVPPSPPRSRARFCFRRGRVVALEGQPMLPRVLARQRQLHHELLLTLTPDSCRGSLLKYGREAQSAGWTNEHGGALALAHRGSDEKTSVLVSRIGDRLHWQPRSAAPAPYGRRLGCAAEERHRNRPACPFFSIGFLFL
jgi:hypothetical protein